MVRTFLKHTPLIAIAAIVLYLWSYAGYEDSKLFFTLFDIKFTGVVIMVLLGLSALALEVDDWSRFDDETSANQVLSVLALIGMIIALCIESRMRNGASLLLTFMQVLDVILPSISRPRTAKRDLAVGPGLDGGG